MERRTEGVVDEQVLFVDVLTPDSVPFPGKVGGSHSEGYRSRVWCTLAP